MSKLNSVWVVAENPSAIGELTAGAAALGVEPTLVYAGDKALAKGTKKAYYLGNLEGDTFITKIPAVVNLITEHKPDLVLLETSRNGRLTAAAIGAAVGTAVLTDANNLELEDGIAVSSRLVYGGAAIKREKGLSETAVVCVGGGVFEAGEQSPSEEIIEVTCSGTPGIRFVEKRPKTGQTVNLSAAKNVVGVGRGLGKEENLQLAKDLAAAIGGEVGCSRPVAEEEKWMPKEAYVGVSGVMLKPNVYIGAGISGQVQHMVGVNQAKTIVAVNKDKNAPIFKQCDYGIVGDLTTVLPALAEKFKG